ncbi:histone-lysine N-methyltransferase SETMAR-like [Belonocnema kinseyi]|uniref:histone-lysine N-methyltransferase SETMAR-like n=1 Tax=Belonocnema kinseyi TaxID=2817044 RepID=UPI00143DC80B|nr:histone-lysine N-methyltransferase SETMAR-like [Belonocnema kinseyi]
MDLALASSARCELRSLIRFLSEINIPPVEILSQLCEIYGDKCMSIQHVRKWCREFKNGLSNTNATNELIAKFEWSIVKHPPYSLDLAPSHYYLFPVMKKHLDGTHFGDREELEETVLRYLRGLAADFFDSDIQKLVHRVQKCVELSGDYVEK